MDGNKERAIKKADKILKTDWRIEKMYRIADIFDRHGKKELTSDDVMEDYRKEHGQIDDTVILDILKRMSTEGMLHRERRSVKIYPSGHVKCTSRFFYTATPCMHSKLRELDEASLKEMKETIEGKKGPKFEVKKVESTKRPAFSSTPKLTKEELQELQEQQKKMVEKIEKVKEITKPIPLVSDEPKKVKADKIIETLTTLDFNEAMGSIFRGQKVVSAVSGVIYAMVPGVGIRSTANPKEIVTKFPLAEMEGKWRVVESPKMCPFCGGQVKLVCNGTTYQFVCQEKDCQAAGPHALTPEEAVNKFNKRC